MNETPPPLPPRNATPPYPTPDCPLRGTTVLVVDDSRLTCETLRLLCQRSGSRLRRADSLATAQRHLQVYCPNFVLIDMGLPDGNGLDLIRTLSQARSGIAAVLAISGDEGQAQAALRAGADRFIAKPFLSLSTFQEVLLQFLPKDQRPMVPRAVNDVPLSPDRLSYVDDLRRAARLLAPEQTADQGTDPNGQRLEYIAQFLLGTSRSAGDVAVQDASMALAVSHMRDHSPESALTELRDLLNRRIAAAPVV